MLPCAEGKKVVAPIYRARYTIGVATEHNVINITAEIFHANNSAPLYVSSFEGTFPARYAGGCRLTGVRYATGTRVRKLTAHTKSGQTIEGYVPATVLNALDLKEASAYACSLSGEEFKSCGYFTRYQRCGGQWVEDLDKLEEIVQPGQTLHIIRQEWAEQVTVATYCRADSGQWFGTRRLIANRSTKQIAAALKRGASKTLLFAVRDTDTV